jgi:succinate dehydrogenase/fumarate reductase cytochrome b subunit
MRKRIIGLTFALVLVFLNGFRIIFVDFRQMDLADRTVPGTTTGRVYVGEAND